MSIGQIMVLAAIVGAFVVFAAVLGWGDFRAQQPARQIRDRDRKGVALAASATVLKTEKSAFGTAQARWPQSVGDRLQGVA